VPATRRCCGGQGDAAIKVAGRRSHAFSYAAAMMSGMASPSTDRPLLSFIVPAHDEAPLIGACLQAVQAAARACGQPFELVVVDDASTDATADIARAHGAQVLRVEHRHIAATRNAGAREARGDLLVFVDADTRIEAPVLRAALAAVAGGAVGGGCAVRFAAARWHERWLAAVAIRAFRLAGIAPGCFLFCTRAAFEAAGGFDERYFAAEDVALSRGLARVGRVAILREPVTTSERKLRTFGVREHLRLGLHFLLHGRRVLHSREHLALWYAQRRHQHDRQ
jgi:glycosyltransferase involved in cell wall biosynthesis